MKTSQEIIQSFISSGYKHMENIPNNRVFYTDNSASTLAWVEGSVVIEYYFLFPNLETPLHSHPFENQMIFISGDLTAYRKTPAELNVEGFLPDTTYTKEFKNSDVNTLSKVMPIGFEHGFTVGPRGSVIYNIQIWPDTVTNPLSAAIEYFGTSMGPRHDNLVKEIRGD